MVVASATTSTAWDRRDGETAIQHRRLLEWLQLDRYERADALRRSARLRDFYRLHEWPLRAAAYDDARSRDFEHDRDAAVREMRSRHAQVGRAMLAFAVARLQEIDEIKAAELIKLADLGRRMELIAMTGSEAALVTASRTAANAAGFPLDEWDQLAADLASTIPTRA